MAYGACSPDSHYHVILIMTSFATELATPSVTDVLTSATPYRVYKDVSLVFNMSLFVTVMS